MSKIAKAIETMKGPEQDIINVGRNDLPEFFKERGYKVGAEIGVCKGEYTEKLAQAGLKIFAVDPYRTYSDYDGEGIQERLNKEYDEARDRLSKYDVDIVRKSSMEAVQGFADESLDFVYIDGHHGFKFVTEDIYEWSKKVKKGGVISGHDFVFGAVKEGPYVCHVKYVVRAYTKAFGIKDWYVLGRHHFPEDKKEIRDRWRSWMWIK